MAKRSALCLTKEEALKNCNDIRTILMISVVLAHSCAFYSGYWFAYLQPSRVLGWATCLWRWINSWSIYAFVLVSGYVYYHLRYHAGKYQQYRPFLKTKAKRLLLPYVLVSVLWAIPCAQVFHRDSLGDIVRNYALGYAPAQLWFLLVLFGVFALVWPLSDFFCRKGLPGALAATIGFYGVGVVGGHFVPNLFGIWAACEYVGFFYIGMKLCQHHEKIDHRRLMWAAIALHTALFVLLWVTRDGIAGLSGPYLYLYRAASVGAEYLMHALGGVMAFEVLQAAAAKLPRERSRAFGALADSSMTIYLLHQQLIYFCVSVFDPKLPQAVTIALSFLLSIGGAMLLGRLWNALVGAVRRKAA